MFFFADLMAVITTQITKAETVATPTPAAQLAARLIMSILPPRFALRLPRVTFALTNPTTRSSIFTTRKWYRRGAARVERHRAECSAVAGDHAGSPRIGVA